MTQQMAFIATSNSMMEEDGNVVSSNNINKLNSYLEEGWRVINSSPMGVASSQGKRNDELNAIFSSLVILEKGTC